MDAAVSFRNIWRNKRRTLVILTAILIGVASMIFLASLMRGMMEGMVDNAIDELTGHIQIQEKTYREDPAIVNRIQNPGSVLTGIRQILPPGSQSVTRIIIDAVINTARDSAGVRLAGIDFASEKGISFIGDAPLQGSRPGPHDLSAAVMGRALARKLGLETGKRFVLSTQNASNEITSRSYTITGLFSADMDAVEKKYLFVSRNSAENLLGLDQAATEIAVTLPFSNIADTDLDSLVRQINQHLTKGLVARDWRTLLPALDAYLSLFNQFLMIWYLTVFIAMGFGIVNTVLMAVYERMHEFGLLKAIGMTPMRIFKMVVIETLMLLFIGMAAGNVLAFGLIVGFSANGIDLSAFASGAQMWGMKRIIFPVADSADVLAANLTVFILGLAVGVYPAIKAARFSPVETMRMT